MGGCKGGWFQQCVTECDGWGDRMEGVRASVEAGKPSVRGTGMYIQLLEGSGSWQAAAREGALAVAPVCAVLALSMSMSRNPPGPDLLQ